MTPLRQLRPLIRVALPVAVAVALVCMAVINIALVKTWHGELDDGVLWQTVGADVVAQDVAPGFAGDRAGIKPNDKLVMIGDQEITRSEQVVAILHTATGEQPLPYVISRQSVEKPFQVDLLPMPTVNGSLYYSLALVGILSIVVGASVRLRRPNDPATLHFFWLTVAFFGVLAFTPAGRYNHLDYFFEWSDAVARLALPPLFLHFAFVFPDRPNAWANTDLGRAVIPVLYLPALLLGVGRVTLVAGGLHGTQSSRTLEQFELFAYAYLGICLLAGLLLMLRALTRLRSMTARRQLRWIVWGSSLGALPFVVLYILPLLFGRVVPLAEYTAVLLGCIPLAFASAIVRYRLMDIEVIIKKALVVAAVVLLLVVAYAGVFWLVNLTLGADENRSSFWALFAMLVGALIAPWLWNAIQNGLDRLYYKDRYDYRKALVSFARELNTDLDLGRLSSRLAGRIRETLGVDKMAVFLPEANDDHAGPFVAVASEGFEGSRVPLIRRSSALGGRLLGGQMAVLDDPQPIRRFGGEEAGEWREAGLYSFVPCVSKDVTIAVLAVGRRPQGEPLSSEDIALLGAVAGQAATALENARLYGQLSVKAAEIERLRQFGDSVVESLSDGLIVVDLEDRVLRWNRRVEALTGIERGRATGRRLAGLFAKPFLETLQSVRRESSAGGTVYRVPLATGHGDDRRLLLVNLAVAPFQTSDGSQAGWIVVLEDITDRANLEEQLRLSEKMAAIGLLAAGVAHEVNTPLTGISSFTQMLLERSAPDDPRTQLLEKIERQTFRAAKIVNSLLNLARPSGGETGPVDLNAVIGDILSLLEHQFKLGHVQVRKDLASSGVVVRGMEYKLQQVFLNLFLNARDAMPKGGWLTVATRLDTDSAIIEVADTGVGIPVDHIGRIYDPFFTTKPEGRGTGLGLSVTYGIVQEHGGTLTCESQLGQGTRFRLVLPLMDQPTAEAATR
ncbi:MAG TPA: ATP-binding protein [Vicinamibacterales bacterium]|nr:ATP-binding protein [Vicinamibacterales bacterium]